MNLDPMADALAIDADGHQLSSTKRTAKQVEELKKSHETLATELQKLNTKMDKGFKQISDMLEKVVEQPSKAPPSPPIEPPIDFLPSPPIEPSMTAERSADASGGFRGTSIVDTTIGYLTSVFIGVSPVWSPICRHGCRGAGLCHLCSCGRYQRAFAGAARGCRSHCQ